jgi:hypothetical protein
MRCALAGLTLACLMVWAVGCSTDDEDVGLGRATTTVAECQAEGGRAVADPGDGSVYDAGCDLPEVRIGELLETATGGICCAFRPILSLDGCDEAGGEVLGDPGDHSLVRGGCPDLRENLGFVDFGFEGGLCCGPVPAE